MNTNDELFTSINEHLLGDEKPSIYLNKICKTPEFKVYPFNMLLALQDSKQSPKHHPEGNVWNHTMLVVDEAANRKYQSKDAEVFMWAALLHDIGKPPTTKVRKGRITSYNHDTFGAKLADEFLSSLDAPKDFIDSTCALVRFHMHVLYVINNLPFGNVQKLKQCTDVHELALLGLCDRLGRTGSSISEEEKNIQLFLSKIQE
ncbi:HDIG domain-containing metalloprotein [Clostridium aminobutyricum]|uniref:HDIG domain-containing protein n=1 Tax=Clostridium aminobutyricum TaxID=33953 RepID=A0A939IHT3_CLOAM|nr:HDIG domain-containing metalloprotein [Clostridium aminobutyricum]MBN7774192.1 HDIG domain-containing protein [Clostridium aminobutyricum]